MNTPIKVLAVESILLSGLTVCCREGLGIELLAPCLEIPREVCQTLQISSLGAAQEASQRKSRTPCSGWPNDREKGRDKAIRF